MKITQHQWQSPFPGVFHDFRFGWIVEISREWNRLLPHDYFAHIEAPEIRCQATEAAERFSDAALYSMLGDHVAIRRTADNVLVAVFEITSVGQRDSPEQRAALIKRMEAWVAQRAVLFVIDFFEVLSCLRSSQVASKHLRIINGYHMEPELSVAIELRQSVQFPLETTYWRAWQHVPEPFKELVEAASV